MSVIGHCGAISRQGNVCAREEGHEGCHEVYVDGDGRRWWGEMSAVELAEQLRGAVKALEEIAGHFLPGDERRTYAGPTDTLDMIRAEARDALSRLGGQ